MLLDPVMPTVHKMVEHTLKLLQYLLQDFKREFDYFVNTKHFSIIRRKR